LLSQGADVNLTDNSGFTALHWGALKGKTKTVSALVFIATIICGQYFQVRESNPDFTKKDYEYHETAAEMAKRKGFLKLAATIQKAEKNSSRKNYTEVQPIRSSNIITPILETTPNPMVRCCQSWLVFQ
jgi:ankyrin repeat protein